MVLADATRVPTDAIHYGFDFVYVQVPVCCLNCCGLKLVQCDLSQIVVELSSNSCSQMSFFVDMDFCS